MLNWIVWNRTVWHLTVCKQITVLMLNWIVWNRTVWHLTVCKQITVLMLNWIVWNHHHHHIVLAARISLTLSRHSSLSFIALGRSSGQHPVSSHSCWMYVRAGRPAFARPCVGIHKSTSLMSSSLLLQQCPACLVRLTWIDFVIGGRWPYSWCLVGCRCQDLLRIARRTKKSWYAIKPNQTKPNQTPNCTRFNDLYQTSISLVNTRKNKNQLNFHRNSNPWWYWCFYLGRSEIFYFAYHRQLRLMII